MPTVARLSIAPVKSTGLHHPKRIVLHPWGAEGNRVFHVVDPDGGLINAADLGSLLALRTDHEPAAERLAITFPDGTRVEGDGASLGRAVVTVFFGRPAAAHVLDGPWAEALSSYLGRPVELARCDRPGDGNDDFAASLFSTASAQELARRSGQDRGRDSRRFRMLIEVEGCEPHQEDSWIGGVVRVGGAVLRVAKPVARCVITTKDPDTGRRDLETLAAIAAYRGMREGRKIDFGVYADVLESGTVSLGDEVRPESI